MQQVLLQIKYIKWDNNKYAAEFWSTRKKEKFVEFVVFPQRIYACQNKLISGRVDAAAIIIHTRSACLPIITFMCIFSKMPKS